MSQVGYKPKKIVMYLRSKNGGIFVMFSWVVLPVAIARPPISVVWLSACNTLQGL